MVQAKLPPKCPHCAFYRRLGLLNAWDLAPSSQSSAHLHKPSTMSAALPNYADATPDDTAVASLTTTQLAVVGTATLAIPRRMDPRDSIPDTKMRKKKKKKKGKRVGSIGSRRLLEDIP